MVILGLLACYLLGSIPFGYVVARAWNVDIRRHGSGNIGATNVFRIVGVWPGVTVFILDFLKGTLAVWLGFMASSDPLVILLFGFAAILGHMYSCFMKFKGGKGAATGLGVLAGIAPDIFIVVIIIAIILISVTRYVSVASIFTSFAVWLMMVVWQKPSAYIWVTFFIAVFILFRHIPNVKRLLAGTEHRFGHRE
ncbi:MAG: glycerol-3-phosphate 1-O-acyltransferase PlsY [bacterium]